MKIDAALLSTDVAAAGKDARLCEEQGFDGVLSFEEMRALGTYVRSVHFSDEDLVAT